MYKIYRPQKLMSIEMIGILQRSKYEGSSWGSKILNRIDKERVYIELIAHK